VTTASATSNVGSAGTPWSVLYSKGANVTVMNVTSVATLNVNTRSGTGSPYIANVLGNILTSNSVTAQTANATTMNTGTLSIVTIAGTLGVGTATSPAATLYVGGNIFVSDGFGTRNIWSTTMNSTSLNASTIVISSRIGDTLSNLNIPGNAFFTNAMTIGNIFATSANISLNVTTRNLTTFGLFSNINTFTINTSSFLTGTLAVGSYDPFTSLNVLGNATVSNAITANIYSGRMNVTGVSNIGFISGPIGLNTPGDLSTGILLRGNIFVSNSVTASNVYASQMVAPIANVASIQTPIPVYSFAISGNVFVSNSLTTTNVLATSANSTTLNVVSISSTLAVGGVNPRGTTLYFQGNSYVNGNLTALNIYTSNANAQTTFIGSTLGLISLGIGGANVSLAGNAFVSNSIVTTNLFSATVNAYTINAPTLIAPTSIGGTRANLFVDGNVFVSNSITVTNIYATNINTVSLNVLSIYGPVGIGSLTTPTANLYIVGNLFIKGDLTTPSLYATSINTSGIIMKQTLVASIGTTSANLFVSGNAFVSNTLAVTNIFADTVNSFTINTQSFFIQGGIGYTASNLYVQGNLFASNATSTTNIFTTFASSPLINAQTLVSSGNIGIGTRSSAGANLYIQGNLSVSNALSVTNILVTGSSNISSINVVYFYTSNVGIGTAPTGASLGTQGNAFVSNALATTNVFVSGSLNVATINTSGLIFLSGTSIGSGPQATTLYVQGNAFASNALTATNVYITGTLNAAIINTMTLVVTNNVSVALTVFPPNLLYLWNFDGTAVDAVGGIAPTQAYISGTLVTSPATLASSLIYDSSTAKYGSAISLSNPSGPGTTTNTIYYKNNLNIPFAGGASSTVTFWVKFLNSYSAGGDNTILFLSINGGPRNYYIYNGVGSIGTYGNWTGSSVGGPSVPLTPVNGTWYHLTLVITSTSSTMYLNGSAGTTTTYTSPTPGVWNSLALATYDFGAYPSGATSSIEIDDLRVYNTALSAAEIQVVYQSQVIIKNSSLASLFVQGNVFATDMTINNVFISGSLNVLTLNTFSVIFNSNVGVGTTSAGTTNLYVQGNVFVSGTAGGSFVTSPNLIYTVEDVTLRSPHLVPNPANGPIIQAWISGTCNASSQPQRSFWLTSQNPAFSNVTNVPNGYQGAVLLPDGRVLFVPYYAKVVGFYQPKTQLFSTSPAVGMAGSSFSYGLLLPTGNVVFCPQVSNVGLYNPLTSTFSNIVSLPSGSYSGTLNPSGNVVFTPMGVPSNIIHYNYTTGVKTNCYSLTSATPPANPWSSFSASLPKTSAWIGIAWSPQLMIFCAVAQNGSSAISPDGLNWKVGTSTVYGGINVEWSPALGVFCMRVYQSFSTATSPDGLVWTLGPTQSTVFSQYAPSITAWSPQLGLFCSVSTTSQTPGGAATSRDGLNWTLGSLGTNNWEGIAWSPQLGIFCVVSNNSYPTTATSRDGITWTTSTSLPQDNWDSVAWSPQLGLFCAVCYVAPSLSVGNKSATSRDGVTWSTTSVNLDRQQWQAVTWSPQLGMFCAVVNNVGFSGSACSALSRDGVNWTGYVNLPASTISLNDVAWSPQLGVFCTVGVNAPTYTTAGSAVTSGLRSAIQAGSILLPNGNIITASPGSSNVIQYNPSTMQGANLYVGTAGFNGLALAPNGNVIGVPQNSNIIVINPRNFTSSNIQVPLSNANCVTFFGGGCLTPSGNLIFAPSLTRTANVGSSNVGMFDPSTMMYSNSTPTGSGFTAATLVPSGQVIFGPGTSNLGIFDTMAPVSSEFCLSPYLNKF
jgi:hypothetical protein